jgi:hypothetical protein
MPLPYLVILLAPDGKYMVYRVAPGIDDREIERQLERRRRTPPAGILDHPPQIGAITPPHAVRVVREAVTSHAYYGAALPRFATGPNWPALGMTAAAIWFQL